MNGITSTLCIDRIQRALFRVLVASAFLIPQTAFLHKGFYGQPIDLWGEPWIALKETWWMNIPLGLVLIVLFLFFIKDIRNGRRWVPLLTMRKRTGTYMQLGLAAAALALFAFGDVEIRAFGLFLALQLIVDLGATALAEAIFAKRKMVLDMEKQE